MLRTAVLSYIIIVYKYNAILKLQAYNLLSTRCRDQSIIIIFDQVWINSNYLQTIYCRMQIISHCLQNYSHPNKITIIILYAINKYILYNCGVLYSTQFMNNIHILILCRQCIFLFTNIRRRLLSCIYYYLVDKYGSHIRHRGITSSRRNRKLGDLYTCRLRCVSECGIVYVYIAPWWS